MGVDHVVVKERGKHSEVVAGHGRVAARFQRQNAFFVHCSPGVRDGGRSITQGDRPPQVTMNVRF